MEAPWMRIIRTTAKGVRGLFVSGLGQNLGLMDGTHVVLWSAAGSVLSALQLYGLGRFSGAW